MKIKILHANTGFLIQKLAHVLRLIRELRSINDVFFLKFKIIIITLLSDLSWYLQNAIRMGESLHLFFNILQVTQLTLLDLCKTLLIEQPVILLVLNLFIAFFSLA